MALLTAVLLIVVIAVSATGDNGALKGPGVIAVFAVYVVIQVVCIVFMKPQLSVYKIGFYALHIGVVVMLVGFALFELGGQSHYVNIPVDSSSKNGFDRIQTEDGSLVSLGFGVKLNNFTVEKYESGAPKQYVANMGIYRENPDTGAMYNSDNVTVSVNDTYRCEGWKVFLMSYDDGSSAMQGLAPIEEYTSVGGAQAAVTMMMSSGKYDNATIDYFEYDPAKGGRVAIGTDASVWESMTGKYTARVYQSENTGNYYVCLSRTYVQFLFKKDPGEYVVLTGMALIILGVILMCIIRGKNAGDEEGRAKTRKKLGALAKENKKGSGNE